jgi:transcriptional regulator with XRE-family HTH domain
MTANVNTTTHDGPFSHLVVLNARAVNNHVHVPFLTFGLKQAFSSTRSGYAVLPAASSTQAEPAGLPVELRDPVGAMHEIRRLSGLTWEECAEVFCVSRQAVHDWANGKQLKPANLNKVQAVLAAFRGLPAGNPTLVRASLLSTLPSGSRPIDLLSHGDDPDYAISILADLLSTATMALAPRKPHLPNPVAFMDRLSDRPIPTSGPAAKVRSRRIRVDQR